MVIRHPADQSTAHITVEGGNADAAFDRAFASGAKTVFVPPGTYRLNKTLRVPSGMTIKADKNAVIMLADGSATATNDYLLTNADHATGNAAISIEGGIWDGNNRNNPRPAGLFDAGYTGALFHFQHVKRLTLKNCTLLNAEAYYARFTHVDEFHVENICFDSDNVRPNNDGIHLGGNCSHGVIRNLRGLKAGVTGDDMVALNADDALGRTEVRGLTNGPISDIEIENLEAEDCHTFVRLLSVWSPIRNVTVRNIRGSCSISAINADGARGTRVPLFDEKFPPFSDGVGLLENIELSDFQVTKSRPNDIALLRLETRMKNFRLTHFKRMSDGDKSPQSPTLRLRHIQPENILINGQHHALANGAVEFTGPEIKMLAINTIGDE